MDEPKLISLKDAIKNAFKNLFDNASLGFLFKSYISLSLVMAGAMLIIMVPGFIVSGSYFKKANTATSSSASNISYEGLIVPESSSENFIPLSRTLEANTLGEKPGTVMLVYGILAVIVGFALTMVSVTYAILVPIKMHRNNLIPIKELLAEAIRKTPKYILLSIPMGLLIGLGYLLFIIPGVILTLMLMFAPYILLTEDVGVIEALKRSKELTKGYRWNLYKKGLGYGLLISLCFIPITFLMAATQGIMVCILTALTPLVLLKVFEDLKNKKQEMGNVETPEKPENNGNDENVSEETPTEKIPEILEKEEVEMEHTDTVEPENMEPEIESDVEPTEIELEDVETKIPVVATNLMETNELEQFQPPAEVENIEAQDIEDAGSMEVEEEPTIDIPNPITMRRAESAEPEKPEIIEEPEEKVSTPEISVEEPQIDNFAIPEENQENQTEETEGETEVNE